LFAPWVDEQLLTWDSIELVSKSILTKLIRKTPTYENH
jgi:hypothetical protein